MDDNVVRLSINLDVSLVETSRKILDTLHPEKSVSDTVVEYVASVAEEQIEAWLKRTLGRLQSSGSVEFIRGTVREIVVPTVWSLIIMEIFDRQVILTVEKETQSATQ